MRKTFAFKKPAEVRQLFFKWVIGIDPGKDTGLAIYDVSRRDFEMIETLDFWKALDRVQEYPVADTKIIVEVPEVKTVWHAVPKGGIRAAQRQAVNVGAVIREAELLAQGIEKGGYKTIRTHPQGKVDKNRFQRITGHLARLNQHERDAGMLCWGGRPTAF